MKIEAFTWKDCGPSSDPAQIQALSVAPDPLKFPGKFIYFQIPSIIYIDIFYRKYYY
jgi:hypothetical protein